MQFIHAGADSRMHCDRSVTRSGCVTSQSHVSIYQRNYEYPGHRVEAVRNNVPNGLTKRLSHRNEKGEKGTERKKTQDDMLLREVY